MSIQHNNLFSLLQNPKKAKTIRRFCVVEGIYSKTGEICPLKEIAAMCRKSKVRIFVDETLSFGVLGATGRGITEYLDVPVMNFIFIILPITNFY